MDWLTARIHRFSLRQLYISTQRCKKLTSYISLAASLPAPGNPSTYFIRSFNSTEPMFANGKPTMITHRPRLSEKLIPSDSLPPTTAKSRAPLVVDLSGVVALLIGEEVEVEVEVIACA